MPIAYHWISGYEENEGQELDVHVHDCLIIFTLTNYFAIEYKELGKRTRVICEKEEEEIRMEGRMIDVFCEDFREFLINRKEVLGSLKVRIQVQNLSKEEFRKEELIVFFKPFKPILEVDKEKFTIGFNLNDSTKKQADHLSFHGVRSLEVFANPLLMKMILKKVDFFDIMPTAYHWISGYEENEEQELDVHVHDCLIIFTLTNYFAIEYKEMGKRTQVICGEEEEEIKVKGRIIDVFCDDFREFLMNRKEVLGSLKVYGCNHCIYIHNKMFECMKFALKSRSDKLQVNSIQLDIFSQRQVIALLKLTNPKVLTSIFFDSTNIKEAAKFLVKWNKGYRLDVYFQFDTTSKSSLTSVKNMLKYPFTFGRIQMQNLSKEVFRKEELILFFKPFKPIIVVDKQKFTIGFNLNDPSEKQIDPLNLQGVRSVEVFANPLLMGKILKKMDFVDVQHLRKVSRNIRSCIDFLKLTSDLTSYSIEQKKSDSDKSRLNFGWMLKKLFRLVFLGEIEMNNNFRLKQNTSSKDRDVPDTFVIIMEPENGKRKCIRYQSRESLKNGDDWHIDKFIYCGDQLIERVVNDFETNIRHQRSTMDCLTLKCNRKLFELIGNVLKLKNSPLGVKELKMEVANEKDIMNILPYLDSVEDIYIVPVPTCNLNLTDVSKLNQWRNASKLRIFNCTIMNSIQELNILNFQSINITVNDISTNDVIYLKENLMESVNLFKFYISFDKSLIDESLFTLMPPPNIERPGYIDCHQPERKDGSFHEEDYTETNFFIRLENNECKSMVYDSSTYIPEGYYQKNRVHRGDALLEMAANDFKVILQHQKSILDNMLFITGKKCMKSIGNVLKSRNTRLRVKSLDIVVKDEKDVMNILPYLNSVKYISIIGDSVTLKDAPKLKQWRSAFHLNMHGCTIWNSIQELNLRNFEKVDIKIYRISSDDMIYLKENLYHSVKPFEFKIAFENSTIDYRQPVYHGVHNNQGIWYFPLSTADKFLHIKFSISEKIVIFKSVDRDSVPQQFLNRVVRR
uniref:F-box domain-containing protein n=1 Tax=Caenorhabditis tropicalis TaxID=1561998 RepID=A0A1I7UDY7_9PELO